MKPLKYLLLATILSACGGKYTDPTPQGVESLFNSQKITVLDRKSVV